MADKVRDPESVVKDLAPAYFTLKKSEKDKDKYRKEFFAAITKWVKENEDLAERIVEVEAPHEDAAIGYVEKYYPQWMFEEIRHHPEKDGWYEVIILENPEYHPYTITFDGKEWGRQVASGSTLIDDDRIVEEDPNLWLEITEIRERDLVTTLIKGMGLEPDHYKDLFEDLVGDGVLHRGLRPLESLDETVLARLQKYLYEGKPVVKLPAPKNVKED